MTIGFLACEDKETSEIDLLVEGVWVSETTSSSYETLDFKGDMTYKITSLVNNPIANNGIPIETGYVMGLWVFEDSKIIFTTKQLELNSNNSDIDMPTVDGQPLGSFYGYETDGIYQNFAEVDSLIWMGENRISLDRENIPTVWTVKELNENSLIVKYGSETIKYTKQ